jgi:membrane fusion protein (multidrug efflux system)
MAGAVAGLAGCEEKNAYVAPPPPEVTVRHPVRQTITTYKEFTGTAQGYETVDLRARVKGFLKSFDFVPGSDVKKGQLLFVIDPETFEAAVALAKADLANKKALLASSDAEYRRAVQLFERNVYAELDLIKSRTARDAAEAAVAAAQAALRTAELDLGYTRVTAPIDGQISRNFVDVGNLVGNNEATLLATIVRYDPIYAYFTVSESDLFEFREMRRRGERPDYRKEDIPVGLGLAGEEGFPHEGKIQYADPALDPETGTITGRAVFPNPDGMIVPGAFIRLRVPFEVGRDALLVPQRALGSDQAGRYVLVVDSEGIVEQRTVRPGSQVGEMLVIEQGLKPDDWVVVNGLQRARPGTKVKPVEAKADAPEVASLP